jgi:hypothetical protein
LIKKSKKKARQEKTDKENYQILEHVVKLKYYDTEAEKPD